MLDKNTFYDQITGEMLRKDILKRWNKLSQLGNSRLAYKLSIVRQRQIKNGYSDTPNGRGLALREVLIDLIKEIRPSSKEPNFNQKPWRMYTILKEQYLGGKTTDVVIEKLGISKSTYHRDQSAACDLLAEKVRQLETQLITARLNQQAISTTPFPLTTHLIGRDSLLKKVKQLISKEKGLALIGLPGVGKTALATAAIYSADINKVFPDGILWANSGRNSNILSELGRWATALGIQVQEELLTIGDWGRVIRGAIGTKKVLIIIDDVWSYEDLLAFQVGGINCGFLITTRFPKVGLRFPPHLALHVNELSVDDGMAMLAHLAPEAVEMEPTECRQLVKGVGSLPLAILLIGNYLRVHSYGKRPRTLRLAIERLHQNKKIFELEEPQSPSASHPSLPKSAAISLQSTIGISFENLDDETRQAINALSVFPPKSNTFSEESALAISESNPEVLDNLVIKYGLLDGVGVDRYTIHQTIADFARIELQDKKPLRRMVEFFKEFVSAHQNDFNTLTPEISNIFSALNAACEQEMYSDFIQITNALHWFWMTRGQFTIAKDYLHQALEYAKYTKDVRAHALTLHNLGRLALKRGRFDEAENLYKDALRVATKTEDSERIIACYQSLGALAARRGKLKLAEKILNDAKEYAYEVKDNNSICGILINLGGVSLELGKLITAHRCFEEILEYIGNQREHQYYSLTLQNLGSVLSKRGDHNKAIEYYREALEIAESVGDQERRSAILATLAVEAYLLENNKNSEELINQGLEIAQNNNQKMLISRHLTNRGVLLAKRGKHLAAIEVLQQALALVKPLGSLWDILSIQNRLGDSYLQTEKWDDARNAYTNVFDSANLDGHKEQIARAYFGLAQLEHKTGNFKDSHRNAASSLKIFEEMSHRKAADVSKWMIEHSN